MRGRKVVLIAFAFIIIIFLSSFLNYYAYYHSKNLDISVQSSSEPSGALTSLVVSDGLGVFPQSWRITFKLSITNQDPSNHHMEETDYEIYLGQKLISEGQLQNVYLPSHRTTSLPDITLTLSMEELAESNPQLIANALRNQGEANFKISVTIKTPALLLGVLRVGTAETSDDLWESVHLVDSVSVSSFHWHSDRLFVSECHPSEDMVGEFRISGEVKTEGNLEARITAISSDGLETILATKELEKLGYGYQTRNTTWHVPDSPPMDCIGFSIHLLYGGIEVWSAQVDPPSLQLVRRYTLSQALDEDDIDLALSGTGYCAGDAIKLEVKVDLEVSIDLEIEVGTVLINSGAGQNMIIGETRTVRVEPKLETELKIEAYCLDLHRDNPSSSEIFAVPIGSAGYSEDAIRLMQSLEDVPYEYKSLYGVQIALWAIIEDPTKSEVQRVFPVSESSLEDAAWLLENIGIDPNQKRLFSEG